MTAAYYNKGGARSSIELSDIVESVYSYVNNGGNLFVNSIAFKDTIFVCFPLGSIATLNPSGGIFIGKEILSPVSSDLDLSVSHLISVNVKGIYTEQTEFLNNIKVHHMADSDTSQSWIGNPPVCGVGQYNSTSGKIVLVTLPFHDC